MASIAWALLLFLAQLHTLAASSAHGDGNLTHHSARFQCRSDQAEALLQLKQSFSFVTYSTTTLPSWRAGTDCCLWEGVGCSNSSGHVTVLDLSGRRLYASQGLDPALFNLTSLQLLDLSMNDFGENSLPATGFERLALLTHLNLSNSAIEGQIPIGISKLVNLISLDLSNRYDISIDDDDHGIYDYFNFLWEPNFQTLVANLSNLRELYLDQVDMSGRGEEWCNALAKSVPHLQVLSLEECWLKDPIHHSLSGLRSLVAINLQYSFFGMPATPFPEFFADFLNLSVLRLAGNNLQGQFPHRMFQLKNLRVLDLSGNLNLSGHLPNYSTVSSLETLRLEWTNFSLAKPISSSNFKSLKELGLDGKAISMDILSSFGMLGSLSQLALSRLGLLRESGPIFLWIGYLKNLTSLELSECDFSRTVPSSIGNFKSLRSLTISDCNLTRPVLSAIGNLMDLQSLGFYDCRLYGSMPTAIGNLTKLTSLDIENCGFLGPMPSAIGNLTNLRSLYIYNLDFSGPIPSTIGFLRNLKSLGIDDCKFDGQIPSTIGFLRNLKSLEVRDCKFDGPIPSTIGNLSNLRSLDISYCQFLGPIPSAVGQLNELTLLRLRGCSFSGGIPSLIFNLTRLVHLDLSVNHLSGEISTSLLTIPSLRYLYLSGNQLSGPIQEFDVFSSHLVSVDLSDNELTGQIPMSFFQLTSLMYLYIGWNSLVGSVDLTSFWRLRKLTGLDLSDNKLSVMDGEENNTSSTYLSELRGLYLARCSITRFPSFLTRLDRMYSLDLSRNKISGDIPQWIWERWNSSLRYLNLSHNMFTGMQLTSYVLPTNQLSILDLSSNRLQGQIPMPNSSAQILDYSNNSFSSVLPNFTLYLSDTTYLRMTKNNISGHIPHSICNSTLDVLDLSYNNFSGPIPSCLIENGRLSVLSLRENRFQGTLPSNITSGCAFQTIDLHGNKIEGQLPRALSNCTHLEVLDFGNNQMVDTFPSWLGQLPNLYVLVLRSNRFYGSIGDFVGDHKPGEGFSSLQIIDLASNNFSGNLSSEWFERLKSMMVKFNNTGEIVRAQNLSDARELYQDSVAIAYKGIFVTFDRILTTLTAVDFSNNSLEGTIPESIGKLVSLRVLNMSHNAFTGKIPSQLGRMTDLESMDLSSNQLSGEIPQELTNLTFLSILDLSNNELEGQIPQSHQFSTFDNSSFEGNAGLCGPPLSKPCGLSHDTPSEAHVNKSSQHVDVVLFLFVGLGFGVGFAAAIVMRWGRISKWFIKTARASPT